MGDIEVVGEIILMVRMMTRYKGNINVMEEP